MASNQWFSYLRTGVALFCVLFVVSIVLWILLDSYVIERGITTHTRLHTITSYSGTIHGTVFSINRYASCECEIVQLQEQGRVDVAYYQIPLVYDVPLSIGTPVTFAYTSHGSLLEQVTRVYLS